MTKTLTVGDARKFTAKFFDLDGILADPDTVTFEVKHPDGTIDIYSNSSITKEEDGVYSKEILFQESGNWSIEWEGSGNISKVANSRFYVKPQIIVSE